LLVSLERWEFPELKRQADIWRPTAVLIEDAASGQSLIQALKSETWLPILPVKPQGDKVLRAHAVSPLVESGRVVLPESAPWLADFIEEIISFPAAPHDDQTDAFTQALSYLRGSFFDSADWQRTGAMQLAYHAARRRGASAFGEMIMNSRDMETIEDSGGGGVIVNGQRYTNAPTISRRSGW